MKVSVIIPTYNSVKTIFGTIEAVKSQKYIDYIPEIIVVDDGSHDGSFEKLQSVEGIKLVRQNNSGPASARNFGARISTSDILVFTDSDTLPLDNWLFHLTKFFSDQSIVATTGTYGIENSYSRLASLIQDEIVYKHSKYNNYIKFGGSYNFAIRKSFFFKIGGFEESYKNASGEDTDLCYKILNEGYLIRYVPEAIVKHFHPEKIINYIKTQFKHGYWRAKIYYSYPNRITGDDYTGNKEIYETLFSGGLLLSFLLLPYGIIHKRNNQIFPCLFILNLFFISVVEAKSIFSILNYRYKMFGFCVFFIRSLARTLGFVYGLLYFLGKIKNK